MNENLAIAVNALFTENNPSVFQETIQKELSERAGLRLHSLKDELASSLLEEYEEEEVLEEGDVIGYGKVKLEIKEKDGGYVVDWIEDGKHNEDKSYVTTDLEDAKQTRTTMLKQIHGAASKPAEKEKVGGLTV